MTKNLFCTHILQSQKEGLLLPLEKCIEVLNSAESIRDALLIWLHLVTKHYLSIEGSNFVSRDTRSCFMFIAADFGDFNQTTIFGKEVLKKILFKNMTLGQGWMQLGFLFQKFLPMIWKPYLFQVAKFLKKHKNFYIKTMMEI